MQRSDAEKMFALVADIHGDLRDRIVVERWWLVWIVVGCQMPMICHITQWLLAKGERREWVFIAAWGANCALILLEIALISRRSGGQRTMTERYIWGIWITFILCSTATSLVNRALGLEIFQISPIIALLACFAFAMMAMVAHWMFATGALFFFAVMLAMNAYHEVQFLIYGWAWFVVLVFLGLFFRLRKTGEAKSI